MVKISEININRYQLCHSSMLFFEADFIAASKNRVQTNAFELINAHAHYARADF